jgi:DNA-binding response OmpR family regulator
MKVILYPNSYEIESLVEPIVDALNLSLEVSRDTNHVARVSKESKTPVLAILGFGVSSGIATELCRELSQMDTPHLISILILGEDSQAETIATAFTAGADDYITLPSEPGVLAAKISAATRRLERFSQMLPFGRQGKPEQEGLAEKARNPAIRPVPPTEYNQPKAKGLFERQSSTTLSEQFLAIPTLKEAKAHTLHSFEALHIPDVKELATLVFDTTEPIVSIWTAILVPARHLWLDILVEADRKSAEFLYHEFSGKNAMTTADTVNAMIQLTDAIKGEMQGSFLMEGDDVVTPIQPCRILKAELLSIESLVVDRIQLAVGSSSVQVCISYYASERASDYKRIEQLKIHDVTGEMIPLPHGNHPLLNVGVSLDERKLDLLKNRFLSHENEVGIQVFAPSAMAKAIHRHLGDKAAKGIHKRS